MSFESVEIAVCLHGDRTASRRNHRRRGPAGPPQVVTSLPNFLPLEVSMVHPSADFIVSVIITQRWLTAALRFAPSTKTQLLPPRNWTKRIQLRNTGNDPSSNPSSLSETTEKTEVYYGACETATAAAAVTASRIACRCDLH